MPSLNQLPAELLTSVVEALVRDYLFEYFVQSDSGQLWNPIVTLRSVSLSFRCIIRSLLASSLSIPPLENDRMSVDPNVVIRDAWKYAGTSWRTYFGSSLTPRPTPGRDGDERCWTWKDSPLLQLYSIVREIRLRRDCLRLDYKQLPQCLPRLLDPITKLKEINDARLMWPAMIEASHLTAFATFGNQLSVSATFFNFVRGAIFVDANSLAGLSEKIELNLLKMENLEDECMKCVQEPPADIRLASPNVIYPSRIVPALRGLVACSIIDSDPMYADWRKRIAILLQKWEPLNDEIRETIPVENYTMHQWTHQ